MICRNCSSVISDDCEKCPSCGKDPGKRGQNRKTGSVVILLILFFLFASCTAAAFLLAGPKAEDPTAQTETTAFFALKENDESDSQTETGKSTEKISEKSTEKSTEKMTTTEPAVTYDVKEYKITDSKGKTGFGRGVINADKEKFQKKSKKNINSISSGVVAKGGYAWLTVDFGDSTGIVFLSDSTSAASYGVIDDSGLISELFGVIIIGENGSCTYYPVSRIHGDGGALEETDGTRDTTEKTEETTVKNEEAKTETQAAKAEAKTSDSVVYITATGGKFHRAGCASLSKSKIEINRSEAVDEGYEPCKRCNP